MSPSYFQQRQRSSGWLSLAPKGRKRRVLALSSSARLYLTTKWGSLGWTQAMAGSVQEAGTSHQPSAGPSWPSSHLGSV